MKLVRLHANKPPKGKGIAVTIGNFDGMHLGHQKLIKQLKEYAPKELKRSILTFYPHPREFFLRKKDKQFSLKQINSLSTKLRIASEHGLDYFFLQKFGSQFSKTSPTDFVEKFLLQTLDARFVVVGDDWHFGKNRAASTDDLKEFGKKYGFEVMIVPAVSLENQRISTSSLKHALDGADLEKFRSLSKANFFISGKVRAGDSIGKSKLGYATANIEQERQYLPKNGVYITRTRVSNKYYPSITNVGIRPTFGGEKRLVETHLLEIKDLDLYKKRIEVEFLEFIREEIKFEGIEMLVGQISKDVEQALKYHSKNED